MNKLIITWFHNHHAGHQELAQTLGEPIANVVIADYLELLPLQHLIGVLLGHIADLEQRQIRGHEATGRGNLSWEAGQHLDVKDV